MWTAIVGFFGSMFSSSRLQDTAIDGIRKLGGLDEMDGKEKAQFLLDYLKVTANQSPMRRFIAAVTVGIWALLLLVWLVFNGIGWAFELDWATSYSGQVFRMMEHVLQQPYNIILGFYFGSAVIEKLRGK